MAFFLPSFFQKRILRYALSRLDLLDTDALDLEKLDIVWGKKSTVELRDVGVRTRKLAGFLQLPDNLAVVSAQILYLRLTIPADLYYSGILVEVQGVQVRINANLEDQCGEGNPKSTPSKSNHPEKPSKSFKADTPRSTQSHVHDPGGGSPITLPAGDDRAEVSEYLPTTIDLAKSFLHDETKEQKAHLQGAITRSRYLDESLVTSDDDETSDLGVANALSLPGFLADFLKSVGDRVQVIVKDVELDLDIKMDVASDSSANSDTPERSNLLTVRFFIENITVNAITHSAKLGATGNNSVEEVSKFDQSNPRKIRRITLTTLQIIFISDASSFATVARSTGPSSPEMTHASIIVGSGGKPMGSPILNNIAQPRTMNCPLPTGLDRRNTQDSEAANVNDFRQSPEYCGTPSTKDKFNAPLGLSDADNSQHRDSALTGSLYSSGNRLRSHEEGKGNNNLPESFSYGEAAKHGNFALFSTLSAKSVDAASLEGGRTPPAAFSAFPPTSLSTEDLTLDFKLGVRSQDSTSPSEVPTKPQNSGRSTDSGAESSSPDSYTVSPIFEDLAESKLFSHEEAESMYMSALSNVSAPRSDRTASIPGQWGTSSSDRSDEGRDPLFLSDNSSHGHRRASISPQLETFTSRDGLTSHHGGPSGRVPRDPNPELTEHVFSTSRLPTFASNDPVSPPRLFNQQAGSSQGSEASSANLKSPFRIMKRILSIDFVALELSHGNPNAETSPTRTKKQQPAVLSQSQTLSESLGLIAQTDSLPAQDNSILISNSDARRFGQSAFIDIGNIHVLSDMGLAKLMILVTDKMNALYSSSPSERSKTPIPQAPRKEGSHFRLKTKRMSWMFVDVVKGVPVRGIRSQIPLEKTGLRGDSEILLRAEMQDICAVYRNSGTNSALEISTRKFSFGYISDDILSFDTHLRMRESTRDIIAPHGKDVKLMLTKTVSATKIELTTLPLHVALDSRRLDETFAWFGGFSSMIGLGSSMMSTMTVVDVAAKSSHTSRLGRGVRFEGQKQDNPKSSIPVQSQNKVTARIGGLVLDLQGTRSSLRLESTAMKLVSRTEGLGLQVDRLNVSGPYLQHTSNEPSTAVNLSNLRIEYLSMPKEKDLDRLLALLSPSKDEYERDDDILLETLLGQRRQGGVVRATVENLEGVLSDLDHLHLFTALSEDLKKFSNVTKYLPEDDRPGILTLLLIRHLRLKIQVNSSFGAAILASRDLEAAHVTFPNLVALGIATVNLHRNDTEELVGHALPAQLVNKAESPMLMARFIGNEMEPTAKVKLYNVRFEYRVPTLLTIMGLKETTTVESIVADMVSSVSTLTTRATDRGSAPKPSTQGPATSDRSQYSKELRLDIALRDSLLGLNPRKLPSKGLLVFTDTHFVGSMPRGGEADAVLDIRKASLMVIDDYNNVSSTAQSSIGRRSQVETLSDLGYVSVSLISAAKATINVIKLENSSNRAFDLEIRDDLFVLESCADSTQTLQSIIAGLTPPTPPCTESKYRTEVIPVKDMLASFSGDAFPASQTNYDTNEESPLGFDEGDMVDDEIPQKLEFLSSFYNPNLESVYEGIADSVLVDGMESLSNSSSVREIGSKNHPEFLEEQTRAAADNAPLDFQDNHFGTSSVVGDPTHQQKSHLDGFRTSSSPLRVRVRDVHFIWNLYDGYDWQNTRDTISQAIENVQIKATERLARNEKRKSADPEEEEDSVIGDFLFNSIYIGIPANRDPRELGHQVNRNLDDLVSETESYATSTSSGSPSRKGQVPRTRGSRKPRLKRSKYHKMTFELKGVSADVIVFPPDSGDTQSALDIRVQDLEIFDHVPTSTWKKFATYMHEAGERESETDMIHLEILNVKPVPNLAASEIILKATILPLRLHIDQDALDFMTRFFEFKENSAPMRNSNSEAPFLQRVEVNSIRVKFDFKPKRVDYAGIRSGHTNEFMNFFILEQADMILRRVIIYGVSGFEKLGKTLNDIWMPDVKGNQLPGVLAGLSPIRSLVNVGGGFRNLVAIPIREYRKDGRVVRSLQKGAVAFAKTTTSELVKLGAKLAIGTQTVLQGAEDLLTQPMRRSEMSGGWEDTDFEEEEKPQISAYADQPIGVVQGLRGGYASLERDLLTTKDAIIAIPGEILESGTAGGVARAVLKGAPTIILRPAMGVSNAVGQALMGATNSLDPENRRRIENKYKRH